MIDELHAQLVHRLTRPDLDRVELAAGEDVRLRIDVVQAGQLFYWITFIAADDAQFDVAFRAKAAMRSFPWTMPFKARLERRQAGLPVLCRWQRAYAEDTSTFCLMLLSQNFRVPLDAVRVSGDSVPPEGVRTGAGSPPPATAAKQQKVWLREITAWYMTSRD